MDSSLHVPIFPNRIENSQIVIQNLEDQIVVRFHPQKIILFGSYAYRNPRAESDVDLLVIMETPLSELVKAGTICRQIPHRFGLDLVVCTPQRLTQCLEWSDSFLIGIIK